MNRIILSLKDKKFRYGSFSTAMILFVIAIFLMVNLVAGQLNISKDLTADQMYSLSSYSKEFLAELDTDVTLYALFQTGSENLLIKQLLEEYAAASSRVRIEYRDPVLYPAFVEQYAEEDQQISNNSVIVVSGGKSRVVLYDEMFTQEIDYNTWSTYITSIDIEPQISRAIYYVTTGDAPVIYNVTGSNEYALPEALVKQFKDANYEIRDVNLMLEDIPEDCAMLLITSPGRDWSNDKADIILQYLQNDGRALFMLGYQNNRYPIMDDVLAAYGVRIGDYVVVEGDANYYYRNTPYWLIPRFTDHEITQPLLNKNLFTLQISATGIDLLPVKKASTTIEPLFTTSNAAYGKTDPNSETINKEASDKDGPFSLAVAVTDSYYTEEQHLTKLVLFGGGDYMQDESINTGVGGTNWDLLINSANWLQGQASSIYIPAKSAPVSSQLTMTQGQANMLALIAAVIIPLILIVTGLTVWLRRRHS